MEITSEILEELNKAKEALKPLYRLGWKVEGFSVEGIYLAGEMGDEEAPKEVPKEVPLMILHLTIEKMKEE